MRKEDVTAEVKEPWQMTRDEMEKAIDEAQADMLATTTVIDWGSSRKRQGKRAGHMVVGGMSAAPRGRKEYIGCVPNYPEWAENIGDIKKRSGNWFLYSKARELGWDHYTAGRLAVINNFEKFHDNAIRRAISEGKPVPPEVLKDYPELT